MLPYPCLRPILPLVVSVLVLGTPPSVAAAAPRSAEAMYLEACAACHGVDGQGAPQDRVGFDVPLPDFTDCSFATREADADWVAVTHEGGPARAFSRLMPAFGEALTVAEIELALSHVRSFCPDDAWPRGELNLPRPLVTTKAFPEDEAVITTTVSTEGPGSVINELLYETRIGARNQFEIALPFGWNERFDGAANDDGDWRFGIGDLTVGVKRVLFDSLESGSILSASAEFSLPTGDEDDGFSAGTTLFEPSLLYGQILPYGFFLHAQAGLDIPFDGAKANEEAIFRTAIGRSFQQGRWGRVFSPMVEVLGARELVSGAQTDWDLLPQMQVTLSTRQHMRLNAGVRVPVTDTEARDTQFLVYLLWDWFDGGFFEGW